LPPIVPIERSLAQGLRDFRVDLQLGQRRPGADRRTLHAFRDHAAHVDERLGLDDPVSQERDELRSAR
jgi:hypothetical protein